MAIPVATVVKAAAAALADERGRKVIGGVVIAVLSPLILIVVFICCALSMSAAHNNAALRLSFKGGAAPLSMPIEYRQHITDMQSCFTKLESILAEIREECEFEDGEPDFLRIRAVFYALFFGQDSPQSYANRSYMDCFFTYETRTRTVEDEDGNGYEEEYIAAIPITDLPVVYANVGALIGRTVTPEDAANITEIYYRVQSGDYSSRPVDSLAQANGTHAFIESLLIGDDSPVSGGGFISPVGANWRSLVTCEFGSAGYAGHTGIDLGVPVGTPIRAAAAGKVLYTRMSTSGYGYHVVINHGGGGSPSGGIVTLYAHCSKLFVSEGQQVSQGDIIALSGSTGNSTGPHVHFEIIVRGKPENPRNYLP